MAIRTLTTRRRSRRHASHRSGVEPTRVLAVANTQEFIQDISEALRHHGRINLLGGATGRIEAAERIVLLKPDVIVIEANLDYELGGIDTAFALRKLSPGTAFVLLSPYTDPERLAMVPRGLGLEWSYVVSEGELNGEELANAISSASWSIPYIDHRIDSSLLGKLKNDVEKAVESVMTAPPRSRRRAGARVQKLGYAGDAAWNGNVTRFTLPDVGMVDPDDWRGV